MTALSPSGFTVTVETAPRGVSLRLAGELDLDTADDLVDAVRGQLTGPGRDEVCLDCADLTSCDSSGLAALLMARRLTAAAGVGLRLADRPPHLTRMLEITGTLEHLTEPYPLGEPEAGARESHGPHPGAG
ncbi:STAS domain-containing protein [Streptomyces montanisoli]|uniref:STAS domain-containing protein n=1 Tax=Streptomyces montanisoli TaxID=2798581 RepID=A0A940MDV6_9ACTN|nr:STAS domain-containing protein [Streptomyces montanisoli]MBP0457306.1 STAS domain-containing protein [Streptomyces montanisoli]